MSIHVPGQSRSEANPLLVLAAAADKTNNHLGRIEYHLNVLCQNTAKETRHIYAMGLREPGVWGTYCLACSEGAQSYVYPCSVMLDEPTPPSHISILPPVETD